MAVLAAALPRELAPMLELTLAPVVLAAAAKCFAEVPEKEGLRNALLASARTGETVSPPSGPFTGSGTSTATGSDTDRETDVSNGTDTGAGAGAGTGAGRVQGRADGVGTAAGIAGTAGVDDTTAGRGRLSLLLPLLLLDDGTALPAVTTMLCVLTAGVTMRRGWGCE